MVELAVCYAKELAPLGIEASIVVPGAFTTGTTTSSVERGGLQQGGNDRSGRNEGLFAARDRSGAIAIAPCLLRDEAAVNAAPAFRDSERVMAEVKNVSDGEPAHSLAASRR